MQQASGIRRKKRSVLTNRDCVWTGARSKLQQLEQQNQFLANELEALRSRPVAASDLWWCGLDEPIDEKG